MANNEDPNQATGWCCWHPIFGFATGTLTFNADHDGDSTWAQNRSEWGLRYLVRDHQTEEEYQQMRTDIAVADKAVEIAKREGWQVIPVRLTHRDSQLVAETLADIDRNGNPILKAFKRSKD